MRNKHKLFWMVYVIIQSSLFGQNFLSTVKEDSVFIFLTKTPAAGQSVIIERQGPQDSTFIQLNKDPIQPVLSVDQARRLLGADYQDIADALHTENMQQTLFLLRNDLFYGGIITLLNRNVGRILGRFFAAGGVINLNGATITIYQPNLTVAGQTAPSPGITFVNGSRHGSSRNIYGRQPGSESSRGFCESISRSQFEIGGHQTSLE